MNTEGPLFASLNELAALTVEEEDLTDAAEAVVAIALDTIGCEHAGLTIIVPDGFESLAPSGPAVELADRLQHELRQGPCVEAAWETDTFVSSDLSTDPRWPEWGKRVAELGLVSVLATRLANGAHTLGALNLYSSTSRDFSTTDRDFAQAFAVHATTTLLAVRQRENLLAAVDARTLIGQAQGILMERYDVDAERAFSILRRYSQTRNVKLRTLAEEVIASRTLPPEAR
ncbi:MAG: GAF and ANTAR domain-containing protein [Nocardioidaceae bacterium]